MADPIPDVVSLLDQVRVAVGKVERDLDGGILPAEFGKEVPGEKQAQIDGGGNLERALGCGLHALDVGLCRFRRIEQGDAALVERATRFREAGLVRRALEEANG